MKKFLNRKGSLVALSLICCSMVAVGCANEGTGETPTSTSENTGSLGLNLTLGNGAVLNTVDATISGDALASDLVRSINVSNESSTVSAFFGGLPAGDYSIALSATSEDGDVTCSGSADFTVTAGSTVGVTVPLTCNNDVLRGSAIVNGTIDYCPAIDSVFVAPLQTAVGSKIAVEASATDDAVGFAWSATAGSFADASAASTDYTCVAAGDQILTLTIQDESGCEENVDVPVTCVPGDAEEYCGDGVVNQPSEECEPAGTATCDAECQIVDPEFCGDDVVNGTEECEPAGTDTCNAACQLIECGDGVLEGDEECEPAGVGSCSDECIILPFCGDGEVNQDSEECDGTPDCSAECQIVVDPPVCGDGEVNQDSEECDGTPDCDDTCQFLAVCGDGVVNQDSEECDGSADCDANCQLVVAPDLCGTCQAANCGGAFDLITANCTGGVCDAYQACVEASTCADDPDGAGPLEADIRRCYCGDNAFTTCYNSFAPLPGNNGECRAETEALAGTTVPLQLGTGYFNVTTPLGSVNQVYLCTVQTCYDECYSAAE